MNRLLCKKINELTNKKKKGFTLVELIIVIAIIAILAAIAIPKFGEVRESANSKADLATAKNIATVVAQRIADDKTVIKGADTPVSAGDAIGNMIDGGVTAKSSNAPAAKTFSYNVDSTTGNIIVKYTGGVKVYPAS